MNKICHSSVMLLIASLVTSIETGNLLADKGRKMLFITSLWNIKVNQVFYQLSVKPSTNVSQSVKFSAICQLSVNFLAIKRATLENWRNERAAG